VGIVREAGTGRVGCIPRRRLTPHGSGPPAIAAELHSLGSITPAVSHLIQSPVKDPDANARLEALCDGVFAIAMTLLVIELRAPDPESIHSAADLWAALRNDAPTIGAFLLSFTIIFISWVNHHAVIRSVPRTSATFLFANGFLLLTIAFIPFPTALLGKFVLSDRAAPAVVLYNAVLAAQAVSWIVIARSALHGGLARDADAQATLRMNERSGYGAMVLYSLLSIMAVWLPTLAAILTTATWIVWLVISLRAKHT
jgi:uncharacterized membrane protein